MKKRLEKIVYYLKTIWYTTLHFITVKYDGFRLFIAIKFADAYQRAYNKRYFVIPDAYNKLQVLNNNDIKALQKRRKVKKYDWKNKKYITYSVYGMNPNATHLDIMRDCLYYTSLKANEDGNRLTMAERAKRKDKWLKYMEQVRNFNQNNNGKRNNKKRK